MCLTDNQPQIKIGFKTPLPRLTCSDCTHTLEVADKLSNPRPLVKLRGQSDKKRAIWI